MMARMIDNGSLEYDIRIDDRPSFRFGNGQTQRAVSRLDVMTRALGKTSFYLLDDGADYTPMLIGARELRRRKAMISYKGDWLAYFLDDTWWACSLETLRNGHLALDLRQPRRLLCTRAQGGLSDKPFQGLLISPLAFPVMWIVAITIFIFRLISIALSIRASVRPACKLLDQGA